MKNKRRTLSKTRYMHGLQCERRLWLDANRRELAAPPDPGMRARLAAGHRLGALARERFPGHVLVTEAAARHEAAVATTRSLLADPSVPVICEAAFTHEDVRVRVDALVRRGDRFDLVEVKSGTRAKPEHVQDAGLQAWVVRGAGVDVDRVGILHIDTSYEWPGGPHDLERLFALTDVTDGAAAHAEGIEARVRRFRSVPGEGKMPAARIGARCFAPYACPFETYCWRGVVSGHVRELPGIGPELWTALEAAGIERIADIPNGFEGLGAAAALARHAALQKECYVDPEGISAALDETGYPLHVLGLAVARPAVPTQTGMRPYAPLVAAFSLHAVENGRTREVAAWRRDGSGADEGAWPCELSEALSRRDGVAVYGAAGFSAELSAAGVVDLESAVREHVYDPGFAGDFDLHVVAGVLDEGRPCAAPALDVHAVYDALAAGTDRAAADRLAAAASERAAQTAQLFVALASMAEEDDAYDDDERPF